MRAGSEGKRYKKAKKLAHAAKVWQGLGRCHFCVTTNPLLQALDCDE